MKPHKYILAVDNKYWRVKIRIGDITLNKCFSFIKFGDSDNALIAATAWRDKQLKKAGLTNRLKFDKSPDMFSYKRTAQPCIGVYLTSVTQNNKQRFNWTARYSIDGIEHKKHFSVAKYGSAEAFKKACKIRYKHCGKLRFMTELPCNPGVPYTFIKD